MYFEFQKKKERITRRDSRKVIGHSLDQEMKRSGTEPSVTKLDGKWYSIASSMVQRFAETGHPMFKGISPLSRCILKRKQNKDTIHSSPFCPRSLRTFCFVSL